jgi:hypothetical protein
VVYEHILVILALLIITFTLTKRNDFIQRMEFLFYLLSADGRTFKHTQKPKTWDSEYHTKVKGKVTPKQACVALRGPGV